MKQLKCKYGFSFKYTGTILNFIVVDGDVRAIVCNSKTGSVTIQPLHIITIVDL
jgi:hypothetical protein|nr:MAG TPA: hypothetical protein [Caudoviricetes sp.]